MHAAFSREAASLAAKERVAALGNGLPAEDQSQTDRASWSDLRAQRCAASHAWLFSARVRALRQGHGRNVIEAASELGVAGADLRRLLWSNPKLTEAAIEIEERRLDLAEKNIYEALKSDDPRRRDAASMFTIRNSHRARRRGWITTSTSAAELSVTANAPARTIVFRWRTPEDDRRDAERAETERLRDEGKLIDYEAGPGPLNKD